MVRRTVKALHRRDETVDVGLVGVRRETGADGSGSTQAQVAGGLVGVERSGRSVDPGGGQMLGHGGRRMALDGEEQGRRTASRVAVEGDARDGGQPGLEILTQAVLVLLDQLQ